MRPVLIALTVLLAVACAPAAFAGEEAGKDLIQCKITLPKGEVYMRGATDPVADLFVNLTLTNTSPAERRTKEDLAVKEAKFISAAQLRELATTDFATPADLAKKLQEISAANTVEKTIQVEPVNKDSFAVAYTPPALGPQDLVEFVIVKLPEAGAPAEGAKVQPILRDMPIEHTSRLDRTRAAYLAAGETSPEYTLPVGRFYRISEPGRYSVQALLRDLSDSRTPSGRVESNVVGFRVLPYKIVNDKIASLQKWWAEYERGRPDFDYMFYQLPVTAPYQEIYYVQRLNVRGIERWEWHRLCTLAPGATAQVAQVTPTRVAILAPQYKGDAGLYTVDFSKVDPVVTARTLPISDNKVPTLVVEGDKVEAR